MKLIVKLDCRCAPCGLNGQSGQNVQQPAGEGNKLGLGSVYYPKEYKAVLGITKNRGMLFFYLSKLKGKLENIYRK